MTMSIAIKDARYIGRDTPATSIEIVGSHGSYRLLKLNLLGFQNHNQIGD
jgi:hypothetical protein